MLLSPEQLVSEHFAKLLEDETYWNRICALGVDEVHLLLSWGAQFRKPFRQIGHVRAQLPDTAVLIALTATMRAGPAYKSVCKFLQ